MIVYPLLGKNNREIQGNIGCLEIPKIKLNLPIYEGTDEEILEKGIGRVSANNGHWILAGHRGLPNAEMFLHLDRLSVGDEFYLLVHEQRIKYVVRQTRVIKPDDTNGFEVCGDRELVSLVTCTPYGINSHRLVVTGERVRE